MRLTGLLPVLAQDPAIGQAIDLLPHRGFLDLVAPIGVRPALTALLAGAPLEESPAPSSRAGARPIVVVTATGREAEEMAGALTNFLPAERVALLPAWETLPHERLSPRSDTVAHRLAVFRRLAHPEPAGIAGPIQVLIVPVRALMQPVVAGLGELRPVALSIGQRIPMESVIADLVDAAYTRVDMVERRGEFAVRGGLLDVFAPTDDHPMRVEFWGDEVEEIRWFSVADQRSLEIADHGLWAPPCRELLLTDAVRARAEALIAQLPGAGEMLGRLAQGMAVEGMESLAPVLVDRMQPVVDLLDPESLIVVSEPERVRRRAHDLIATTEEFLAAAWTSAAAGAATPIDLSAASFVPLAEVRDAAVRAGLGWWTVSAFGTPGFADDDEVGTAPVGATADGDGLRVACRDIEHYRGNVAEAVQTIRRLTGENWSIVVTTPGAGPAKRMVEQLTDSDVPARLVPDVATRPETNVALVTTAIGSGFVAPDLKLAVLTEADITGRAGSSTKEMRKMPHRRRNVVDPLQLRAGDYVVHEQHGVARFIELVQRTIGTGASAAVREYMVLEYAPAKRGQPGDRLYVPTDALDQVTKYVGGESPALNRMGGSDWAKTKGRARKAVKEIASELIRLYSARMASPGYAFGPDTPWQRELEDAFAYIETPDQLVTIDEVKADMEKPIPMDRLICGDVGYGKTEIAVRAAFKAVQDGKQVAVLVPTTLLVQQHLDTFSERYAPFPVTVKALSRFSTDAEAKATIDGIRNGTVDVVIGTHRLLTGEIHFKSLGLVIVDEEQRFGVEHKETLKAMRTDVDVLSMSATPIPRTLEMAVSGIREMSTLATPPEERHPILTYVGAHDDKQIAAAIRRELLREGQVFYVHNRVESIGRAAAHLAELVPEARIEVAHGKMSERALEQAVVDFWEKRSDVLVCTTIVETGLDISNANTLIVERSDRFGLSQLHQLRGRVGRGRERAYAYFLYPPERPLTETAHDRLATIAANTDLGAGMAVAMKDLEIRGAGNLLGGEQSGHIAGVGFDLYIRMVSEAVAEFRGERDVEPAEVKIELPIDAHIPHSYIGGERLRLEAYTKLANAASAERLDDIRAELVDRYGLIPEPVENLFAVAALRMAARSAGLTDITAQGKYIRFAPLELRESQQLRLKRLYRGAVIKPAVRTILVPAPATSLLGGKPLRDRDVIAWARDLIDAVLGGDIATAAGVAAGEKS